MTNAHNRFAEILAKYTSAMADIKRPTPAQQFDDDRRVHCLVRWLKLDGATTPTIQDLPGLCDYLLVVAVAAADGV